jgi:hypothetical protein
MVMCCPPSGKFFAFSSSVCFKTFRIVKSPPFFWRFDIAKSSECVNIPPSPTSDEVSWSKQPVMETADLPRQQL